MKRNLPLPKNKALIILDRDGVINFDSNDFIKSVEEWRPIPGSLEAIALLTEAGYTLAIATNQSGIARGLFSEIILAKIHQKMLKTIKAHGGRIAYLAYCPHDAAAHCACRKPKPGMLKEIEKHLQLSLKEAIFIGDTYRDLEAAWATQCQPVLVRSGKGKITLAKHPDLLTKVPIFDNLLAFANDLIKSHEALTPHHETSAIF